jgi:hypothetical protein
MKTQVTKDNCHDRYLKHSEAHGGAPEAENAAQTRIRFGLPAIRPLANWAVSLVSIALLTGCQTPDLKPFADASKTVSATVNTGGDLAIQPLALMPIWINGEFVPPNAPTHPYKTLAASWEKRQNTMDAVLVYSASLAAINDASAHRKENAAALVGSVKQLASAVPGFGTAAADTAGDLLVFGLGVTVEIKAWHDMRKAVGSANVAIQLVAQALTNDFVELSNEFESTQRDEIIQRINALRPVEQVHEKLQTQRKDQRELVRDAPGDTTKGAELARLDGLIASVEVDLNRMRSEKSKFETSLVDGTIFFATAIKAVQAWGSAHADLVQAFEEHRTPNLVLLAARAEELKEIVGKFKK